MESGLKVLLAYQRSVIPENLSIFIHCIRGYRALCNILYKILSRFGVTLDVFVSPLAVCRSLNRVLKRYPRRQTRQQRCNSSLSQHQWNKYVARLRYSTYSKQSWNLFDYVEPSWRDCKKLSRAVQRHPKKGRR